MRTLTLSLYKLMTPRIIFFAGFLFAVALMGAALFLQYFFHAIPCPMCTVQRGFFILCGAVCLLATLHNPRKIGRIIYSILLQLAAIGGALVAARQVWLQYFIDPTTISVSCGPDLAYMLQNLPFTETIKLLFAGSGECDKIDWTLLGLSLAVWSLVSFIFFMLLSDLLIVLALIKKESVES